MVRCGVRVSFEFSFRLIRPFVRLSKVVPMLICEVCPRKDKRGVDLTAPNAKSDVSRFMRRDAASCLVGHRLIFMKGLA